MAFAEGVAAGGEGDGFLVVHRHAREGFAYVPRRAEWVRIAVRAFRVHVDQAHLHRGQRIGEVALAAVALIAQPGGFRAPVDVLFRFPDVRTAAAETEGLEAHGFQRNVAGENQQVAPGQLVAVFLLDRPQQAPGLVEVAVVRPAVERCETLRTGAGAATAVGDAVGARGVPGHADEQRAVVAVVGGPPVLGVGHQGVEVLDHRVEVEFLEFFRVVEIGAQRIAPRGVLMEDVQIELIGPPVCVGLSPAGRGVFAARERALRFT
ncbi:hypothetical protein D9M71_458080 [compost metagenome]